MDGNFDRLDQAESFAWDGKKNHVCALSNNDLNLVAKGIHIRLSICLGIDLGPHSGLGPGGVGKAVNKSFVNSTDVISAAASPRCTIDFTCNHVNLLRNHYCTDGEVDLLGDASLLGVDVADM